MTDICSRYPSLSLQICAWDSVKYQSVYRGSVKFISNFFRPDTHLSTRPLLLLSCCFVAVVLLFSRCKQQHNSNKAATKQPFNKNTTSIHRRKHKKRSTKIFYRASVYTLIFRLPATPYLCCQWMFIDRWVKAV
jgi:hypothetical protein